MVNSDQYLSYFNISNLSEFFFQSGACYCRSSDPNPNNKKSDNECKWKCPGNQSEICGGIRLITVSRIGKYGY